MHDYFLADDLSGALDAAAAFHAGGAAVSIALEAPAWRQAAREGHVVGWTTDTRNADDATAAARIAEAVRLGQELEGRLVFKKIDSTLRGPIAAELRALRQHFPRAKIFFTPANPAAGRIVRDGILHVHGVPVSETEFGRDPLRPVTDSTVQAALGEMAHEVFSSDVGTQEDLELSVAHMISASRTWIPVGSAALARALLARQPMATRASAPAAEVPLGPVLMVCGSAHPLNREQAGALKREHGLVTESVTLNSADLAQHAIERDLRRHGTGILMFDEARVEPARAREVLASVAERVIAGTSVRRIFVTGGETAFAMCARLGVAALRYLDEIEPGVSLSSGRSRHGPILLAVKPGGFGDTGTWSRVHARLKNRVL